MWEKAFGLGYQLHTLASIAWDVGIGCGYCQESAVVHITSQELCGYVMDSLSTANAARRAASEAVCRKAIDDPATPVLVAPSADEILGHNIQTGRHEPAVRWIMGAAFHAALDNANLGHALGTTFTEVGRQLESYFLKNNPDECTKASANTDFLNLVEQTDVALQAGASLDGLETRITAADTTGATSVEQTEIQHATAVANRMAKQTNAAQRARTAGYG
eukprot:6381046-Amphidinium_carterae.2